jgi:hypothetical protein
MNLVSEINKMELEIMDIFKKGSSIFLTLRYIDLCFDISAEDIEKSIRVGDWKIIQKYDS